MVYKTEYSTRRVYSSDPRPTVTSYSYSYNPIARRRAKPVIISSRVIRTPYPAPLGDQQLLNLITTPTVTRTRQYVSVDPPTTGDRDENASYSRTFSSTSSTRGTGGRDRDTSGRGFDSDSFFDRPSSSSTSSFSSSFPSGSNTSSSKTFSKKTETKLGGGRAGSVPMIAVQRLSPSPPPRMASSTRLHNLYQELEDEMGSNSQGLGAIVPYRRSITPIRAVSASRGMSPSRAFSPGPIRRITYHAQPEEESREYTPPREYQYGPLVRNRADDVFLHLALGLQPPLYSLHHIPLRSAMDLKEACDVRRQYVHERNMYDPISRLQSDIYRLGFNRAPRRVPTGYVAGNGTLACLTYAGGKPIPKRRRFYPDEDLASDYKFNNYYKPSAVGSYYSTAGKKPVYQPIYRSKKSLLGLPDTPRTYRKEVPSYWEAKSSNKKSPSPAPVRAPPRRIVAASSPPPAPRAIIPKPEPESNDTVSFVLRKPRGVSQEPTTPVEEVPPPASPVQNLSQDVNVAVKLPRRSVSQEPPTPEPEPEPVEEPAPVEVQVKLRRPSPKPASPEPEPKEPTPPPPPPAEPEAVPEPVAPVEEAPVQVQEEAPAAPEPEAAPAVDTSQDVLVEETIIEAEAAPAEASPEEAAPEAPAVEGEAKGEENLGEEINENDAKAVEEQAGVEETCVAEVSEAASAPSVDEVASALEETSAPAEDISVAAEDVSAPAEEASIPIEETTPQADDAAPLSEDAATISEDLAPPAEAAPVAEVPPAEYSLDLQEQDLSEDKNPVEQDEPLDEPEELPLDEPEAPEAEDRQDLSEEEEELESED